MRTDRLAVLLVSVLVFAGCGGDGGRSASTTTTSRTTSSTTSSSTSTTQPCNFAGTTAPQQRTGSGQTTFLLTDVTVETSGCVETITFELTPQGPAGEPPYRLEYRNPPFAESPSGEPIVVPGNAFVVVRLEQAAIADLTQENAPPSYTGPREITPTGTRYVKGLVLNEAFEGVVGWVIGLDAEHPLRVDETASPARLVLTIGP